MFLTLRDIFVIWIVKVPKSFYEVFLKVLFKSFESIFYNFVKNSSKKKKKKKEEYFES